MNYRTVTCDARVAVLRTLAALAVFTVCACAGPSSVAPLGRSPEQDANGRVQQRSTGSQRTGDHRVRRGETLYAIAWRYGVDFRNLARWNGVAAPYVIYPGQRLSLKPKPKPKQAPRRSTRPRKATPTKPAPRANERVKPAISEPWNKPVKRWRWPTKGRVIGRFGGNAGKGIDISGRAGQAVYASAPGRIVYSGSGLRGYGKLIIIKHNDRYLSAYAHNQKLHAKEGDIVQTGQRIADMGQSDAKRTKLHFEIRRDGKPVDPLKHLPG